MPQDPGADVGEQGTAQMGDNATNPMVNPAKDTDPNAGLDTPKPPDPSTRETVTELVKDKVSLETGTAELERQVAILTHDNQQLLQYRRETESTFDVWAQSFGVKKGDDPSDALRRYTEETNQAKARAGELHEALGIGEADSPVDAVKKLKGGGAKADLKDLSGLPFYGVLLLSTTLARLNDLSGYLQVPTSLQPGNGDEWTVSIDETGPAPVIELGVKYAAFEHADALIRHREASSALAQALQGRNVAEKHLDAFSNRARPDRVAQAAAQGEFDTQTKRIGELEATLAELAPRLDPPKAKTWRFSSSIEDFGSLASFMKGAAAPETA